MTNLRKKFQSWIASKANAIYNAGTRNMSETWKEAYRIARQMATGIVTFFKVPKKDGDETEVTTRTIAPLSNFPEAFPGSEGISPTGTVRVVDVDKLAQTGDPKKSVISFHTYQIIETINAQIIFEEMEPEFEVIEKSIEDTTITIKAGTEYGLVTMSAVVTMDDDCASIENYFTELLAQRYKELEADADYYDVVAEQGYGCTGNYF